MEIDIYCANWKCPICDSELEEDILLFDYVKCSNNCYTIDRFDSYEDRFKVFGKEFTVSHGRYPDKVRRVQKVIDEIKYWKENDRYLVEIMVRE